MDVVHFEKKKEDKCSVVLGKQEWKIKQAADPWGWQTNKVSPTLLKELQKWRKLEVTPEYIVCNFQK